MIINNDDNHGLQLIYYLYTHKRKSIKISGGGLTFSTSMCKREAIQSHTIEKLYIFGGAYGIFGRAKPFKTPPNLMSTNVYNYLL